MDAKTTTAPETRWSRQPPRLVYALSQYSVEKRGTKWFYAKTTDHFQGLNRKTEQLWHGPYTSLQKASFAIASALTQEAKSRHQKLCAAHGIEP